MSHTTKLVCMLIALITCLQVSPALADNVTFNFQGRVKVQGKPFSGVGLFKFAILNHNGKAVLWSNDGTAGVGSNNDNLPVPTGAVALEITDGVFSVAIGDTTLSGMEPLDSAVMVSDKPLQLRVWFSDGNLGFERMNPDQKLTDLTLIKLQTGLKDYTIYVNSANGNNENNGLTTATAKKTIMGAVDILPDNVRCNITVDISPGVYPEIVTPHGISVSYGKTLTFRGDDTWTAASTGQPDVVIDGEGRRDFAFYARQCTGIVLEGISFRNSIISGITLENGNYTVNRCLSNDNKTTGAVSGIGFNIGPQSYVTFKDCKAINNDRIGFAISSSSRAFLTTCASTNNDVGVFCTTNSTAQFFEYNNFSNNRIGVQANTLADVSVWPNNNPAQRTHIQNNASIGALVNWNGQFTPADAIIAGNPSKFQKYYGTIIGVDPQ